MGIVSPDLLSGFVAEMHEYIAALRRDLTRCPQTSDLAASMAEQLNTLAGSAAVLGLEAVTQIAGPIAQKLAATVEARDSLSDADCQSLAAALDQIEGCLPPDALPPSRAPKTSARLPELPAELREIFALEAREHSQAIQSSLDYLREQPGNQEALSELRRAAHTFKGAAASIGFDSLAHLVHQMEDVIEHHLENNLSLTSPVLDLLFDAADALDSLIAPDGSTEVSIESVNRRFAEFSGNYTAAPIAPSDQSEISDISPDHADSPARQANPTDNLLHLPLASMDLLINRTGEIIINRARLERELGLIRGRLSEFDLALKRLHQVAQNISTHIEVTLPINTQSLGGDPAFDPLELDRYSLLYQFARELEEITSDTDDTGAQLNFLYEDLNAGLIYERRLTSDLQDSLLATRLVPFYELETRIRRTVRRTARDLNKAVDVALTGFDTKVDKTILDTLADPLMHLLRNAVDHGIESPDIRAAAQKSVPGVIRLHVARERGRVTVTLSDDGAGIDLRQVQQRGLELGLLAPGEQPSPQRLLSQLFEEGFSLAKTVTQTSGRGVGLDIVRRAINRLQGTVRVDSTLGLGTAFVISVPVTLAITQALFVTSCGQRFAIPLDQITAVLRLPFEAFEEFQTQGVIHYDGQLFTAYDLAEFVRGTDLPAQTVGYGLVIEMGGQQTVVLVESLVGIREAVVKSLGTHLRRVPGVVGATIAGDGSVTLILDLLEIIAGDKTDIHIDDSIDFVSPPLPPELDENPHVLVVDDSPSVRRVVCSFLERMGWQATDAKDGLDALDKIAAIHPDVALVDIEMPRMNGYELLARIKSDPAMQHIPVVFLTSRAAAKHRERAAQLHVDGYLVKPYRENELIDELLRVLGR
jgi:chemosensory pili system protein ChpA (sensor histidine kinase/response regulator)